MHAITLWSVFLAGALFGATWKGVVLASAIALCLRMLPGIPAAARSLIWTAVFLLVVLMPFVSPSPDRSATFAGAHALQVDQRWSLVLSCAWVVLSLLRATQLTRSAMRLHRIAREAVPIDCPSACAELLRRVRRPATLCTSTAVDRPSVAGFFAPRILLPAGLPATLSTAEMEQIILHETEHLRRADDWTNLLQKLALVLFPLNPVLLWVERRLCMERELACDDGVLRQTRSGKVYASCLAKLAEHSLVRRGVSLALGAWERQSELTRRVHRILNIQDRQPAELAPQPLGVVTSLLVVALLGGAAALARSPQLVRFTDRPAVGPAPLSSFARQDVFEGPPAHLSLVKAVMPAAALSADPAHTRKHLSPRRAVSRHRNAPAVAVQQPAPRPQPWVLLTSWQAGPPTLRFAVASYAAVPLGDGWLIIQL